jgi:hypothetical protein
VNKETHGGKKSGSGRGKGEDHSPSRKDGNRKFARPPKSIGAFGESCVSDISFMVAPALEAATPERSTNR